MAHFAQLDENNKVINVIVVNNEVLENKPFPESEPIGIEFCKSLYGADTNWLQTSYNNNFRKRYGGIGMFYDTERDVFRQQFMENYPSWILTDEGDWIPPIPYPADGVVNNEDPTLSKIYYWDEESVSWALYPYVDPLTIATDIRSEETLLAFYKDNTDIVIDPKGIPTPPEWDVGRTIGWRFGELGIWASNLTAWKNLLNSQFEYAVLMEDDFEINEKFEHYLKEYMQELPDDWELLSMYVNPNEFLTYNETYDIGKPNVCRTYHKLSMACYVINKRFVKKALEAIKTPVTEPFDVYMLNQPYRFNSYSIKRGKEKGCRCLGENFMYKSTFQERDIRHDFTPYFT